MVVARLESHDGNQRASVFKVKDSIDRNEEDNKTVRQEMDGCDAIPLTTLVTRSRQVDV